MLNVLNIPCFTFHLHVVHNFQAVKLLLGFKTQPLPHPPLSVKPNVVTNTQRRVKA